MRNRGDILKATKRGKKAGKHFIVYYEGQDDLHFIGGMVTHLDDALNVPMKALHFLTHDNITGIDYEIKYDDSYLVKAKLMKFESWGPFTKVGQLSSEGIEFVEKTIGALSSETWEEYLERTGK